ncbi:MAG: hypothetical protein WCH46_07860 [bacterium]
MKKNNIGLRLIACLVVTTALFVNSCNPLTNAPDIPLKPGESTATISGFGDFSAVNTQVTDGGSTYTIIASQSTPTDTVSITLLVKKLPVPPYSITFSTDAVSQMVYCKLQSNGTCLKYAVQQGIGSGSLQITSISPRVEGTFSGTFQGLTGNVTITDGKFNASF